MTWKSLIKSVYVEFCAIGRSWQRWLRRFNPEPLCSSVELILSLETDLDASICHSEVSPGSWAVYKNKCCFIMRKLLLHNIFGYT